MNQRCLQLCIFVEKRVGRCLRLPEACVSCYTERQAGDDQTGYDRLPSKAPPNVRENAPDVSLPLGVLRLSLRCLSFSPSLPTSFVPGPMAVFVGHRGSHQIAESVEFMPSASIAHHALIIIYKAALFICPPSQAAPPADQALVDP